jgi:hypothetical protein
LGESQRSRDRRGGHHEQVRRSLGLGRQQKALRHAEAVLLVDHRQAQIPVGHLLLENGVGANENVDRAVGEAHQHAVARPAFLAAGEDGDPHSEAIDLAQQGCMMLARQDFRRDEERRLRLGLNRRQHREQRDERLPRADVALEQAQHRHRLDEVAADVADHSPLGLGQLVWELEPAHQLASPGERNGPVPPLRLPQQQQC